jgi:uridine phosphorylase
VASDGNTVRDRRARGEHPIHLKPAAELADRVLLPGDPHRALAVAQALLDQPKMFNHHRGLWGYTGAAPDEELLTVQATGMGGPSAAIVIEELIALGAKTFIRIGTCGAFGNGLELGDVVAVERALAEDGASAALGADGDVAPDPELTAALVEACGGRAVTTVSSDLFYDRREGVEQGWLARGAAVVEMEAATLFQAALVHRVRAGCVLGVTDVLSAGRTRIGHEQLAELGIRLGEVGFEGLARASSTAR